MSSDFDPCFNPNDNVRSETPYFIPSSLEQEIQKAGVQLGLMIEAFQQAAVKIEAATVRLGEEMSKLTKELDRAVEAGREAGRQ